MATPTGDGTRVRASDGERDEYATMLRAAMAEGLLTLDEGEQRLTAAYAARFRDELSPLTGDLPDGGRRGLNDSPAVRRGRRNELIRFSVLPVLGLVVIGSIVAAALLRPGAHVAWPLLVVLFFVVGPLRFRAARRWRHRDRRWDQHRDQSWDRPEQHPGHRPFGTGW